MVKINSVQPIVSNRNLVPINQYNGVILKLTKADKEKITVLQKQKAQYELELHALIKQAEKIKIFCKDQIRIVHKIFSMESNIKLVEEMIKNIKTSRLSKQIAKLAKKV